MTLVVRIRAACAGAALLALTGLTGCNRSAPPTAGGPPAPQVGVMTVQPKRVAIRSELPGRTSPTLIAEVRPQVTGIVKSRNFREGAEVKAGSLMYQIDAAPYQAAYESAQAALAKAEAALATARDTARRYQELVAIKFLSQQDYDDAAAAARQSEADVAAAKAAVDAARINLGYTRIAAPISGRTGKSTVTPGALVTANQNNVLVTIQKLDPIYVDIAQSSADLLRLKREMAKGTLKRSADNGASVGLVLEDGTRYPTEGSLQFTDVTVDPGTGAITLRALFPNPNRELLPGMYVRAVLEEGVREDAIVVPQQAVTRDPSGAAIAWVVGADGKAEPRTLQVARALGNEWLIDAGLKPGERVVVDGLQRVRPGAAVQTVERGDPNAPAPAAAPAAAGAPSGGDPAEKKSEAAPRS